MISRERWQLLEPVLDAALDLPAQEVAAYLDGACQGAPDLREEIERLLGVLHAERDGVRFLEAPPAALARRALSHADPDLPSPADVGEGEAIGPYHILRKLGHGGMGVVYLARDPRLDRLVALKLLPPWLAGDELATRRLAEEAKAASALDHPNLETVYDIGHSSDGRPYIAMAYYEGETLQARIRRGPLSIKETAAVAGQLAQGLAAAHARGIVHRDIKPANVILTPEGIPKVVDFGVAKVGGDNITQPGATPGTVAYMSPEQTRGLPIDARTDVWSLGVVLYEMLTGRRPFVAQLPDAVIYAIRHDAPEPVRTLRPDVPEALARVVQRCLEKDAQARYPDAGRLAEVLAQPGALATGTTSGSRTKRRRAVLGWAAALATMIAGGSILQARMKAHSTPPGPTNDRGGGASSRIAVLPLIDSGSTTEDTYFADGLTEELIANLSRVRSLRVIAQSSVMPYKGTEKSASSIGRELGAGSLLLGGVHKVGERAHVSLRLVDVATERKLWADDYDAGIMALPAIQQDLVERVVAELHVRMGAGERRRLERREAGNAGAYTEYLKGRYFLGKLAPGSTPEARRHFERSLDLDPAFAPAWAGLAGAYNQLSVQELLPATEGGPRARAAAEHALALDSGLAEAHAHLAAALSWYYWDQEAAEQHFRRALELDPSNARAHRHYAVHLRNLGRFEQALTEARGARELDPLSAGAYAQEGLILYMARRYDEALAKFQQLLSVDPRYTPAHFYRALVLAQLGRHQDALDALEEADPEMKRPDAVGVRGYVLARLGRRDEAYRMLARLDQLAASQPPFTFQKALIYVALGQHDKALDFLEQAVEDRMFGTRGLKVEPIFDPLRDRPRFQTLLRKLKLTG